MSRRSRAGQKKISIQNRQQHDFDVTHRMIVGATGQGKSWFSKQALKKVAAKSNAEIIIYTPIDFKGWPARAKIYSDVEQFVAAIESFIKSEKTAAHVYVDEFGDIHAHYRSFTSYPKILKQITSLSRHHGITAWLASQRPTDIPPTIRNNCREKIIFYLVGDQDRQAMQNESPLKAVYGMKFSEAIGHLDKLEAFVIRGREVKKRRM